MRIQDAYTYWSTTYDSDRNLTRDLDQLATEHALMGRTYQNVLEMGCGTGKNTALLTRISQRILAIDFSSGMLKQAKAKIDSENVLFTAADLTKPWPCKLETFQLVVANLVLEHIQDLSTIFFQASRVLTKGGLFFISELHPSRQYQGVQAVFRNEQGDVKVAAFVHHFSEFTNLAKQNGLLLRSMREWWHEEDKTKLPRLVSFMFEKPAS